MARQIERDLGKDARRQFHDMKEAGDRTLEQLKMDAKYLYDLAGKLHQDGCYSATMQGNMMNSEVLSIIKSIFGKQCCSARVGAYRSLSFGFGERVFHNNPKLEYDYYGEWEIGTYYCAWRIMKADKILCGVSDTVDSIEELNRNIQSIEFGAFTSLSNLSNIDVRLETDSGIIVDFLPTIRDEDEYFHIFGPNNVYIELSPGGVWSVGRSDTPWYHNGKRPL